MSHDERKKPPAPQRPSFALALEMLGVGAIPAAAVLAVAMQPMLRYADPFGLVMVGIPVAAAAGLLAAGRLLVPEPDRRWMFWLFMLCPVVALIYVAATSGGKSEWNDLLCARIEKEMLYPTVDTRDDLPDLFASRGCRPQRDMPVGIRNRPAAIARALDRELLLTKPKPVTPRSSGTNDAKSPDPAAASVP